jgi:flavin reductase (DIM6/NTAB) family NADH-FMN oxidoreductase RutF
MSEPFSSQAFRDALAYFASGVTVVTAQTPSGPVGFTASAFTSVSLAPPLVLVCVGKGRSAHDAVVGGEHFGVSVLAERQVWIADRLGRSGVDRFRDVPLLSATCVPLVDGALVQLECRRHATHDAGDHTILVGEVLDSSVGAGKPLVHFGRRLGRFVANGGES